MAATDPTRRRFTYGDQFDPDTSPLADLLELAMREESDRGSFQKAIRTNYFEQAGGSSASRAENSKKLAMNCLLSLAAYGLISVSPDRRRYAVTDFAKELLNATDERELHRLFAVHILTRHEGMLLARLIERINARGERVTLEYLGEEFNEMGIAIPPNSTYISTMREWLARAGVFRPKSYEVNWDVVYDLLKVDSDVVDQLYSLTAEQKHFLLSLVSLDVREWERSNKVAKHTRSVYGIRLTTKNLVLDVLEPLQDLGLIETRKTTTGRGAKPHEVRLTSKGQSEILEPLVQNIASLTEFTSADLDRKFEDVVGELSNEDKYVRGVALELLAVWIIRLLGLRFTGWRLRHYRATGGGEVDVMAASDRIVYNRWQLQCKNVKGDVPVDVIAKEVGLTFVTRADVVMLVTTSSFTRDAVNYANQVNDNSRYYVVLLEGEDIERIVEDRTRIVDILNLKARRVFAKRELGIMDLGDEDLIEDEQPETDEQLERALQNYSQQESLDLGGESETEHNDL